MGPRAGLDGCGKCRPAGIRSPDLPARSESRYRLGYPRISKKFADLEVLSNSEDFSMDWEIIQENIKISAKSIVDLHEWKKHKACSDKQSSQFLDHAKQTKVQWLQDQSQTKVM